MPSLEVDSYGVPAVTTFITYFEEVLDVAASVKPTATVEPALEESDLEDVLSRIPATSATAQAKKEGPGSRKNQQFAAIETAVRGIQSNLIATTPIDSPDFVKVWNLFDVLSLLSDREQCDPALLLWLVEELLDSQTIAGCRKIFDYLESRRKRIISKHFAEKKLIILRSCNELLRRLSRAEDTAFAGRVFIFLFQSFPLGDKSSVNLRGEYHTQNVTTWDETPAKKEDDGSPEKMDVDSQPSGAKEDAQNKSQKAVSFDSKKQLQPEKPLESHALYPIFWSLQESFNQPKKLFDSAHFTQFKSGLEATMTAFKAIEGNQDNKASKQVDEAKRSLKRKRDDADDDLVNAFNPKYLTSRDLFELEISDLSFRRHVLVQALIIMDFLLSLSPKAKEKLATLPQKSVNKSVAYLDQVLSEDDAKWATDMKKTISDYLKQGGDGQYFYRMVDTVLSRDKNWVRWKIENCAPIEMAAVSPEAFADAAKSARSMATHKRLRATPMGTLALDFLHEGDEEAVLQKLKSEERHSMPELSSLERKIADDDFEIEMPTSDDTKADAIEGKASKTWRALRIASRSKLALFDKIENDDKIDIIFRGDVNQGTDEEEMVEEEEEEAAEATADQDDGGDGDGKAPPDRGEGESETMNGVESTIEVAT